MLFVVLCNNGPSPSRISRSSRLRMRKCKNLPTQKKLLNKPSYRLVMRLDTERSKLHSKNELLWSKPELSISKNNSLLDSYSSSSKKSRSPKVIFLWPRLTNLVWSLTWLSLTLSQRSRQPLLPDLMSLFTKVTSSLPHLGRVRMELTCIGNQAGLRVEQGLTSTTRLWLLELVTSALQWTIMRSVGKSAVEKLTKTNPKGWKLTVTFSRKPKNFLSACMNLKHSWICRKPL